MSHYLKLLKLPMEKDHLHLIKFFPIDLIREFIKQPGTLDLLNHWRKRNLVDGVMTDIYDGAVWKSFLYSDGNEMLASRYGIGLAINVDWFQPHVAYSVGVIYICVLNLPHHLRYLRDNIFIVGIIPGPCVTY